MTYSLTALPLAVTVTVDVQFAGALVLATTLNEPMEDPLNENAVPTHPCGELVIEKLPVVLIGGETLIVVPEEREIVRGAVDELVGDRLKLAVGVAVCCC